MHKFYYIRLAITNLKKNSKVYFPYLLTCIGTIILYYIMHALSLNEGLDKVSGGDSLKAILSMASTIVGFFSFVFLFYTNSFLIKRRKKEFGVFHILGMEKKHLARVLFYESLLTACISFLIGLPLGILFSKLMFLLLLNLLSFPVQFGFEWSPASILASLVLFSIIFGLTFLNNIRQVHVAKPIDLLKGSDVGEREPKTKWLFTLLGLISLGGGYYIAIVTESPLQAIPLFFLAVLLVMIGTYALFTTGSITWLKLLRNKKTYYYKTKHFTTVSGMIYRMKQNAIGLANICILSTAVLVMISTTLSLYLGREELVNSRFPKEIILESPVLNSEGAATVEAKVEKILKDFSVVPQNVVKYRYHSIIGLIEKNKFNYEPQSVNLNDASKLSVLYLLPLSDYNKLAKQEFQLSKNEMLLCEYRGSKLGDVIKIGEEEWKVSSHLARENLILDGDTEASIYDVYYAVVPDDSPILYLDREELSYYYGFDTGLQPSKQIALADAIREVLRKSEEPVRLEGKEKEREGFYSIFGGFFFLGIFLGLLFIMATVLIIYYKQVSEGFEDKKRFEIMQKVGMSKREVKSTITNQVLTVFFLPLIMAAIHIAFAFRVITRLLLIFNLTNVTLFALCTIGTFLVFALFYTGIYVLTARVYYKIVS